MEKRFSQFRSSREPFLYSTMEWSICFCADAPGAPDAHGAPSAQRHLMNFWTSFPGPPSQGLLSPGPPSPGPPTFRAFSPLPTLFYSFYNFRGLSLNCGGLFAISSLKISSQHIWALWTSCPPLPPGTAPPPGPPPPWLPPRPPGPPPLFSGTPHHRDTPCSNQDSTGFPCSFLISLIF